MTKHTDTKDRQDILNPKTDWVFKLMFSKGEEGNKALISFLNAFLQETYGTIKKADILNRRTPAGETYHLDLLIKTDNGLIVNLEMQHTKSCRHTILKNCMRLKILRDMLFE